MKKNSIKTALIVYITLSIVICGLSNQAKAMSIDINIPEKYTEITAGERLYFETSVKWPENEGRKDLRIEYSVTDSNKTEVAYLKVLKAIETQASFMDSIAIPEVLPKGMYRISAKISDYENMDQDVATSFHVTKAGGPTQIYLFVILGVFGIMLVFLMLELFVLMILYGCSLRFTRSFMLRYSLTG